MRPKVAAATSGAGLGGALAIIAIWIVGLRGIVVPPEVASAISTIASVLVAGIGGWLTPSNYVLPDTTTVTVSSTPPPKG